MLVDVQLRKESNKQTFHVVDSEVFHRAEGQSNRSLRSCVKLSFSHQHPAWHVIDRQQVHLIVLESLDALPESREVVSDAFASFSLGLVRGKEHLEAFTHFLWSLLPKLCLGPGRQGFDDQSFLSAFHYPLSGMFLAVGNSSWSVFARPTRRAAPLWPPTSAVATDMFISRCSLVLHMRTSCWSSRQTLGSPSHCGSFIRSVLGSVISCSYTVCWIGTAGSGSLSVATSDLQRASLTVLLGFSSGSAATVEHTCAQCPCQTSVRRMFCEHMKTESFLVKAPASHTDESVQVMSELKCTSVQEDNNECAREMCSCWEMIDHLDGFFFCFRRIEWTPETRRTMLQDSNAFLLRVGQAPLTLQVMSATILHHETFDLTHDTRTREVAVLHFERHCLLRFQFGNADTGEYLEERLHFFNIQHVAPLLEEESSHAAIICCHFGDLPTNISLG